MTISRSSRLVASLSTELRPLSYIRVENRSAGIHASLPSPLGSYPARRVSVIQFALEFLRNSLSTAPPTTLAVGAIERAGVAAQGAKIHPASRLLRHEPNRQIT